MASLPKFEEAFSQLERKKVRSWYFDPRSALVSTSLQAVTALASVELRVQPCWNNEFADNLNLNLKVDATS